MKKFTWLIVALISFICSIIFTAFEPKSENAELSTPAVRQQFENGINNFLNSIESFHQSVLTLDSRKESAESVKQELVNLRNAYKKIEFLVAYVDQEFVNDHINGAPLKHLERNTAGVYVLEPEGLQVIEEVTYDDAIQLRKSELLYLTEQLKENFSTHQGYQKSIHFTDRMVFEASRFGIVRLFTMGVSGFDTPASDNAIMESEISFMSIAEVMSNYYNLSEQEEVKKLVVQIRKSFAKGSEMFTANQDFDSFDRMQFLKEVINPLFDKILQLQLHLGIETYYETTSSFVDHPVNYFATNIFSEDFLNPFFYSGVNEEYYSSDLIALGKTLFFDPILSSSNERSCASCHKPSLAFTDGRKKSIATGPNGTVQRNAMGLINAVYADRYFYDLRAEELESQIEHVVVNQKEFHTTFIHIMDKLNSSNEYKALFKSSFPDLADNAINKNSLSTAISAYLVSLSGFNSPFDQYVRGERNELHDDAIKGFNLFMGKAGCATCHFAPVFNGLVPPDFNDSESEVLGVPLNSIESNASLDNDLGRSMGTLTEITPIFNNSFKTTTVRNVSLTGPYMHNGVFETLEEVVDFYNKGGGAGLKISIENQTLPETPLNLTKEEERQLVTFLHSLTNIKTDTTTPVSLPTFENNQGLNARSVGGTY